MPKEPTQSNDELAMEAANEIADKMGLGAAPFTRREIIAKQVESAITQATSSRDERIKELEKFESMYNRLRESVNGMAPADLARLAWFEDNYFKVEQERDELRAQLEQVKGFLKTRELLCAEVEKERDKCAEQLEQHNSK